jgi:hypothetical protein
MPLYTLGRTTFPRKLDAEQRVKEILHGTPLHQRLVGADLRLILGVLAKHPHSDEKLKGGVVAITVAMNVSDTGISSKGFQVVHVDGTYETFSYDRALGSDTAAQRYREEAGRFAIAESIIEFKRKAFQNAERVPCAETGALTAFADCDVHHAEPWPFKKIVEAFIEQNGEPSVRKRVNGDFGSEFVYPKDVTNFRAFHDRLAILQIVSRDVHHRLRSAQLRDVGSEDSDNGECAKADLHKEFPAE